MSSRAEALIDELLDRALRGAELDLERELAARPELSPSEAAEVRHAVGALATATPASEEPSRPAAGNRRFGPYELLRELGRGGQGVVWLAHDTRLSRRVALKVVDRGVLDLGSGSSPSGPAARLRREAEVASRLDHPGICTVYELGTVGERSFVAMRYVEGETLAARIAAWRSGPRAEASASERHRRAMQHVELIERAARALEVAHRARVVHRDIKPANIMVTPAGEPVILDFGLARDDGASGVSLTGTGDLLGSPAYMAPEQIDPHRGPVDARTDVYALGVVLYECLTLRRPFDAPTREGLFHAILGDSTPSARRVEPALPRDLEVVLATALERDPARRYQTALDLAEDLRRVREHEPIRARRAGAWLRAKRWVQRNPVLAASLALVFIALTVALAAAWRTAAREREHARRLAAEKLLYEAAIALPTDPALALRMVVEASARATLQPLRVNETVLTALAGLREDTRPSIGTRGCADAAFDPVGRRLALASGSSVTVWLADSMERTAELAHPGEVQDVEFSSDGRWLAVGSWQRLVLWDTAGWRRVDEVEGHGVGRVSFAPGAQHLLTTEGGAFRAFAIEGLGLVARDVALPASGATVVQQVGWSSDGRHFFAARYDDTLWVDAVSGEVRRIPCAFPVGATYRYAADGSRLVVPHPHGAKLVDSSTALELELAFDDGPDTQPAAFAAFVPDGRRLLVADPEGALIVFDALDGAVLDRLQPFEGPIDEARFDAGFERVLLRSVREGLVVIAPLDGSEIPTKLPTPNRAVAAFWDDAGSEPRVWTVDEQGVVRRWRMETRMDGQVVRGLGHPAATIAFDPAGTRVAARAVGQGRVLELTSRSWSEVPAPVVCSIEFDPRADRLLTAAKSEGAQLRDARSFDVIRTYCAHPQDTSSAAFSPDGQRVVVACCDERAHVFDTESGEHLLDLAGHSGDLRSAYYSGDGRLIVTCSEHLDPPLGIDDRSVRVWDAGNGRALRVLEVGGLGDRPIVARLSPDGSRVAFGTWSGAIGLWEWQTERLDWLRGHTRSANDARFSPDGRFVLSGSADRTLRMWSVDTRELVAVFRGHTSTIFAHAISSDGRTIASQSTDGTLRFWPLAPLARAREVLAELGAPTAWEREQIAGVLSGR